MHYNILCVSHFFPNYHSIDVTQFESFRKADMYSLGLVVWEVLLRCVSNGRAEEYSAPYHERVSHDPPFEEMIAVVVQEQYRPPVPARWSGDAVSGEGGSGRVVQKQYKPTTLYTWGIVAPVTVFICLSLLVGTSLSWPKSAVKLNMVIKMHEMQ